MRNFRDAVLIGVIAFGLLSIAGCAGTITPDFWVKRVEAPDKTGSYKFDLQKTLLRVEKDEDKTSPVVRNIPAETAGETFKFEVKDAPGQTTKLEVAYVPNTRLIYSIGTQVTDHRRQSIEAVGRVFGQVVKLATVSAMAAEKCEEVKQISYPFVIDVSGYLAHHPNGDQWACLPGQSNPNQRSQQPDENVMNKFRVTLAPAKRDWIPVAEVADLEKSVLPYAACRDAVLEIVSRGPKEQVVSMEYPIRIADPRFVETIQMPAQGTLTMHTECGFSMGNIGVMPRNDADTVAALLEQINVLKDQLNKKQGQPSP